MSTPVLVALPHPWEAPVVAALDACPGLSVRRRCVDLADLLAAAAAHVGRVALVGLDLRGLDRSALASLGACATAVVGVVPSGPGEEESERRLRQLGIRTVVSANAQPAALQDAIVRATVPTVGVELHAGNDDDARQFGDEDTLVGTGTGTGTDQEPGAAGRIVAVWGPAGAPGRSTIALNLAAELARDGWATMVVDADPYGGVLAASLALLDEAPGLAAAVRSAEQGRLDVAELGRIAPRIAPRLSILTGLPSAQRWLELPASGVECVLQMARRLVEIVVVDCGFSLEDDEELSYDTRAPRRNAATLTALGLADEVVVIGAGDPIGLQRLVRGMQEMQALGLEAGWHIAINKVRRSAVGADPQARIGAAMRRFADVAELSFIPDDRAALDEAMLRGQVLAESAPRSAVRAAMVDLARSVIGRPATVTTRRRRFGRH